VILQRWGDVPEVVRLMRRSQPLLLRLDALTPADQQRALDFLCGAAVVLRMDCHRARACCYRFVPLQSWTQRLRASPARSAASPATDGLALSAPLLAA